MQLIDDSFYDVDKLINKFDNKNNPKFFHVLKAFIFDMCRGGADSERFQVKDCLSKGIKRKCSNIEESGSEIDDDLLWELPKRTKMLISYATTLGNTAMLGENQSLFSGSFIDFLKLNNRCHLEHILKKIQQKFYKEAQYQCIHTETFQ
ncbi:hypothetical protein B4U79_18618, partial [Dinothrombium tinctorium]